MKRLDLEGAVERELTTSNRLLPARPDRFSIASRSSEVARLLANQYRRGSYGDRADVIFVDKNRKGRRPISELTLRDRVLYRALVELLSQSLPMRLVRRVSIDEFRRAPLGVPNVRYVSKTDVTSFYEFVDHERLAEELESQTGEAVAVEVLMHLLERVMGRRVGLPQIHRASDVLGDTYIDAARRRLVRAGFEVTTYSDDFRVASRSLAEARAALEAVAREVRRLGLALNEGKTFTYGATNYLQSLTAFDDAERALFDDSGDRDDLFLIFSDSYEDADQEIAPPLLSTAVVQAGVLEDDVIGTSHRSGIESVEPPDRAQLRAARRAWDIWVEEDESEERQSTQEAAITESLLGRALPILGAGGDPTPLGMLSAILRFEPALTPQVGAYLTALAASGPGGRASIRSALDELVQEESFSTWQLMWLAESAGRVRRVQGGAPHYDWLHSCLSDERPALAATAAMALGRLRVATSAQLTPALDRVGPVWRMLVLAGIALADPDAAEEHAEDRLERILVERPAEDG